MSLTLYVQNTLCKTFDGKLQFHSLKTAAVFWRVVWLIEIIVTAKIYSLKVIYVIHMKGLISVLFITNGGLG
jgi:hypothetical protein